MKKLDVNILALLLFPFLLTAQTAGDFRSVVLFGYWSSPSTWQRFDGTQWVTDGSIPNGSEHITIQSGDSIMVDVILSNISGYVKNQGEMMTYTVRPTFTGTYEHARNWGIIPYATWGPGSMCLITGLTTNTASIATNADFYNLTWNCPNQTLNMNLFFHENVIGGDIHVVNSNGYYFRLTSNLATPWKKTITINGSIYIDSSTASLTATGSAGADTIDVIVNGNIISKGVFQLANGSGAACNWFIAGNVILLGGTCGTNSLVSKPDSLIFNGARRQLLVKAGIVPSMMNIKLAVRNGSTLDLDTNNVGDSPGTTFTLEDKATLISGHAQGIDGNITNTGAISLSSYANYEFDGTVAQVTGTKLPTMVHNLTINNAKGVALTQPTIINGVLALKAGVFDNSVPFTLGPSGSISYEGGDLLIGGMPTVSIGEARKDDNNDSIPDYSVSRKTIKIYGVVTSPNYAASANGTSYYIQDSTGALNVFTSGTAMNFNIGDSVFVIGTISQSNGLTEISPLAPDTAWFGCLKHNAVLPQPKLLTIREFKTNPERYESQLVRVNLLYKSSGTWPAVNSDNSIYLHANTGGDSIRVFIDKDTPIDGTAEPVYPVDIAGILEQYLSGPGTNGNGYELLPRDTRDFIPAKAGFTLSVPDISFGNVWKDSLKTLKVVVSNKNTTLHLIVDLIVSSNSVFKVSPGIADINPSSSQSFVISFAPVSKGVQSGSIVFYHDSSSLHDTLWVKGKGLELKPEFSASPALLNFGGVRVGTSKKDSITVTNIGYDSLKIASVWSTEGNVFLSVAPTSGNLDTMRSKKFYITFSPLLPAVQTAAIVFASNVGETFDTVRVTGTGKKNLTIAEARKDGNEDLIPDYSISGDIVEVVGVVTSPNYAASAGGTSYYIQDSTAALNICRSDSEMKFSIGDSVYAIGTIRQQRGLTEIIPLASDSLYLGLLKSHTIVPQPKEISLHQYLQDPERYESALIRIDTLVKVSGVWPAANTDAAIYMRNLSKTDTVQMFIDKDTDIDGTKEPLYALNIVGFGAQNSTSDLTMNDGYYILARDSADFSTVTIIDGVATGEERVPATYTLYQNFPNPFNPSTVIKFTVAEKGHATVRVFNSLGQIVATVFSQNTEPGKLYMVEFNAQRLASGAYFSVLESNGHREIKKMMLIK